MRLLQVEVGQLDIAHQWGQPAFVNFGLEAHIAQDKLFYLLDQVSPEDFLVALQIVLGQTVGNIAIRSCLRCILLLLGTGGAYWDAKDDEQQSF